MLRILGQIVLIFMVGISQLVMCNAATDSLYDQSVEYLKNARASKDDFTRQINLARKAEEGFKQLSEDSLMLEAKFLIAVANNYNRDSLAFSAEINSILEKAISNRDTNSIVKAYNILGSFYFGFGDVDKGIAAMKVPDYNNYYAPSSLDQNVNNLGGLIDISLGFSMNLDTVYYYVNKLQQLANTYPDPSVQVVSRFKLAQLFTKALKYEEASTILKEAYPYLSDLDNKGFLHFYYESLINNFIQLEAPDSAYYYIDRLQEVASYAPDDLRNCYIVTSKLQASLKLNKVEKLPEEFVNCYERLVSSLEKSKRANGQTLNAIYTKCQFLFENKQWGALDEELPLLIKYAERSKRNQMLADAYQIKYEALLERGLKTKALDAHIKYKEYSDKINQYVFSQNQSLIKNQLTLQLTKEENKLLQVENQNQKLRIARDKFFFLLSILGLSLLALLVTYFIHLSRVRAVKSKELGYLVEERTAQLQAANKALTNTNKELLDSNKELERFAYIASHDLKTPLHNIIKFSGLLDLKLKGDKNAEIREYLSFIINGGKRMNSLIEDVLEYSKLSRIRSTDEEKVIDLNHLIEEIKDSISAYLNKQNAVVEILTPLPSLKWNHAKLFILLKNLIENGIKYNTSETPIVKLYFEKDKDGAVLYCEDNGIGIEEAYAEKVFQMFYRLHNHSEYEGSGLGLATCKKIVDEFGGKISLESQPHKKTVFKIQFPHQLVVGKDTKAV